MRNLTTRDTRFRFREPFGGQLGEIPSIKIQEGEEVPPLNMTYAIYVSSLNRDEPVKCQLTLVWITEGTEVELKHYCRADDFRLKNQYQTNLSLVERVLDILLLPEQRDKPPEQYRRIETKTTILKEEIPESLQPFVTQVEKWQVFFQKPAMKQLRGRYYVNVSGEGYYLAFISSGCLRLGYEPTIDDLLEGAIPGDSGFDFKPETEPPTFVDDGIYWELSEPKILVILPHKSSNERVAAYYGYLDVFQSYTQSKQKEQDEFNARFEVAHATSEVEDKEKRQQQAAVIRRALLSQ